MKRVAVIGAGLGGLAAALFMARRGCTVDLFEQDGQAPPGGALDRLQGWSRRGAPQARQPHNFLGLSRRVLREEAPDVLEALAAAGCREAVMTGFGGEDPDGLFLSTVSSRFTYETVLRRIALAQAGVTLHAGARVEGLAHQDGGAVPRAIGVRTQAGVAAADLVVDASGRWTKAASWLEEIGARSWVEQAQTTPFTYITRWYRLRPGAAFPSAQTAIRAAMEFGAAFVFPADDGLFTATLLLSAEDPLRGAARSPQAFEAIMAALAPIAPWVACGEPVSEPHVLGRIDNRMRRLVDNQGPVVEGLVLLGDAAIHTNPTLGRGASMAFAQAQALARLVAEGAACVAAYDAWQERNTAPWFASQVQADGDRIAQMQASLAGRPSPRSPPGEMQALMALSADDPEAAQAMNLVVHLLASPAALLQDTALGRRVTACLARGAVPPPPPPALDRAAFEVLVSRSR